MQKSLHTYGIGVFVVSESYLQMCNADEPILHGRSAMLSILCISIASQECHFCEKICDTCTPASDDIIEHGRQITGRHMLR